MNSARRNNNEVKIFITLNRLLPPPPPPPPESATESVAIDTVSAATHETSGRECDATRVIFRGVPPSFTAITTPTTTVAVAQKPDCIVYPQSLLCAIEIHTMGGGCSESSGFQ